MKKQTFLWALGAAVFVSSLTVYAVDGTSNAASFSAVEQQPITMNSFETVQAKPIENPLHVDVKGPIEHYVWTHDGLRDEVWHHLNTGEWRIHAQSPNNIEHVSIYKDGYLYDTVYQNGKLDHAEKVAQPAGYTGKDSVFEDWKKKDVSRDESTDTYAGLDVRVVTEEASDSQGKTLKKKTFVDRKSRLPLKVEVTDPNGNTTVKESWSFDYKQASEIEQGLFDIPTTVQFKTLENPQVPVNKQ